jgi:hypothetical protein
MFDATINNYSKHTYSLFLHNNITIADKKSRQGLINQQSGAHLSPAWDEFFQIALEVSKRSQGAVALNYRLIQCIFVYFAILVRANAWLS